MQFSSLQLLSSSLLLIAPILVSAASGSSVLDLIPANFDKVVFESSKPALVEFFAPWCGHCKNLAPVWEELAAGFVDAGDQVSIAKVDADEHKSLGKRFGVQGFPTLKWFDGKPGSEPEDYKGKRDLESLTKFVREKSGAKPATKKVAPSAVEILTDSTFKKQIGGEKDVLVAFTAPWCGHCKTLAPIWESLARTFSSEPTVLIAKVDAEAENSKSTASSQEVVSYPTIKFFPKGSTVSEIYGGARGEADLVSFVNEKAGTQRVVGGGLNAKAGTIEAVDTILSKYITSGGLKDVEMAAAEVGKTVQGIKDTYADYYLKALNKLGQNPDYAKKEETRLASLLKRGGLAPEKIDDLTSRSNILRRFLVKEEGKSEL